MTRPRLPSIRRLIVAFLAAALIVLAAFVLLEGTSSLLLLVQDAVALEPQLPLARLRHTLYDPDLGWAHVPGVRVDDLYGPGAWLQTNSQGFRAERDFSKEVPSGRLRVICSGDSFTLGYGVANDQTWCARLEVLDPRLETVNMGQGGYGIDQAYLWYRRDGARLDHHAHVFAFVSEDFRRVPQDNLLGYPKPVLAVRGGELLVRNTPVPRRPFYAPWRTALQQITGDLRTAELARRLFAGPGSRAASTRPDAEDAAATREVVRKIIDGLVDSNRARRSELVLVHLPMHGDYRGRSDAWRRFAMQEARQRGLPYLDLVAALRRMPAHAVESFFIPEGAIDYRFAAGHLTPKGNEWVAREVYRILAAQPALAARLAGSGS
jgi:hypothetical protein